MEWVRQLDVAQREGVASAAVIPPEEMRGATTTAYKETDRWGTKHR
jgi:hypothetical protein